MKYTFNSACRIAAPISLAIRRARHHGGMQLSPSEQQIRLSANEMGAVRAPLPDRCDRDDESVREDERQRIARDIHDELGQQILVLRMDVMKLCGQIAETQPQLHAVAGIVLQQLETTMHSLRTVIRGLRHDVLNLGLRAAFDEQCMLLNQRFGIVCELAWNAGDIAITDCCATALVRTLQESLTNVQRHARASRVCITVNSDDKHIVMTVSDNGIGSLPADQAKADSFGLLGMRERISSLGGTLVIASAMREGMMLTITLPI